MTVTADPATATEAYPAVPVSTGPLLRVEALQTYFGDRKRPDQALKAVDGVSFSISPGETFCCVGESGSGKSITALSIMQLVPQPPGFFNGGEIWLRGEDGGPDQNLMALTEKQMRSIRGRRIGMIFQEPMTSLNPVYTIGDQIGEVLTLHMGMTGREARARTIDLLKQVQIRDAESTVDEYPHRFSGGMRQRVMIAMAMACEPDLLIADEPTTALDVTIQAEILRLIRELQDRKGMSVLFITHDFDVVAEIADHVAVMRYGKVVEQGTKQEVLRKAEHPYTQELLAALPRNLKKQRDERRAALAANPVEETEAEISDKVHVEHAVPDAGETVLSVTGLKVHFPVRKGLLSRVVDHVKAVDDVSFDLPRKQILAVVGESGSGKTTLGRAILQLIQPTAGSVLFEGRELVAMPTAELRRMRRDMQIIFQDPFSSLNPRMTIGGMLTEIMNVHGIGNGRSEQQDLAADLMKRVELEPEMLRRYPHEFSGGQRQRIGIARALVPNPRFIVCDEVTSALDVSVQARLLQLLLDLRDQLGLTYLFITHNLGVVEYLADETLVMYKGKIAERGPTEQVVNDPQDDYTKRLLAAVPRMDPV
jgi:peptide/nickel transport system ATP-binding protein